MRNFNVKVNGKTFFVEIEESQENAPPVAIEQKTEPKAEKKVEGGVAVVSPLPGLILKLAVKAGDSVKKNDKIIVLEAMKMEHDILAGSDGKIVFLVKEGDNVESGATLAYIK